MEMTIFRIGFKWIISVILALFIGYSSAFSKNNTSCDTHLFVFKGKDLYLYGGTPNNHQRFLMENLTPQELIIVQRNAYRRTSSGWVQHIRPHEQAVIVVTYPRYGVSCFTSQQPQTIHRVACSAVISGCAYEAAKRQANDALPTESRYFSADNTGAPVQKSQ